VKVVFRHSGGSSPPVTTAVLQATTLEPKPLPTDANYFPLDKGLKWNYRWTNTKHFKQPVVQKASIAASVNSSAQFNVESVSGPIKVSAAYAFTSRLDGITNLWGKTKAASLAKLPALGPKALPADKRRHFFTVFDLMNFGFNPVLPSYPSGGESWAEEPEGRDFEIYGVTGKSRVVGVQTVRVPAGSFRAVVVQSTLRQAGFPFGSGTRTSWFAPGKGLVKLVFRHADGSVSTVERVR
jgi:hypothetical protein